MLRLCSCRGTDHDEKPRPRCPVVLAWMDGEPHDFPRYRCKLGLEYGPATEEDARRARGLS